MVSSDATPCVRPVCLLLSAASPPPCAHVPACVTVWDDRASVLAAMRDGIKGIELDLVNVTTTALDTSVQPLSAYGSGAVTQYLHKRGLVHTSADVRSRARLSVVVVALPSVSSPPQCHLRAVVSQCALCLCVVCVVCCVCCVCCVCAAVWLHVTVCLCACLYSTFE